MEDSYVDPELRAVVQYLRTVPKEELPKLDFKERRECIRQRQIVSARLSCILTKCSSDCRSEACDRD